MRDREPITDWLVSHELFTSDDCVFDGPERVFRFASSYAHARLFDLEPTNATDYE
jgi:hypothetical protein